MARSPLTNLEKEELITRVKAMDYEELEIVLDNIPIEMCVARLKRHKREIENTIEAIKKSLADFEMMQKYAATPYADNTQYIESSIVE